MHDTIIVGGGLLGASTAAALAKGGQRVLLLEARGLHHAEGSSHGNTRVTRKLNFEDPVLNATAADSKRAMLAMEKTEGPVVRDMPALMIVKRDSVAQSMLTDSLEGAGQPVEVWSAQQVRSMGWRIAEDHVAIVDRGAATFDPSKVLAKLYRDIEEAGGEVRFESPVHAWKSIDTGIEVCTERGALHAGALVIASGAWTAGLVAKGNALPKVTAAISQGTMLKRVPLYFFDYPENAPDVIPVTFFENGEPDMYAMPDIRPDGRRMLKVGFHHGLVFNGPDAVERQVGNDEKAKASAYIEQLTGTVPTLRETTVCLYDMAKDKELPILGALPCSPHVYLATAGGGISAKHALAFGEAMHCLIEGNTPPYNLSAFSPARLTASRHIYPETGYQQISK